MQTIGRSTVALAVAALALFTTAAVPGDATTTITAAATFEVAVFFLVGDAQEVSALGAGGANLDGLDNSAGVFGIWGEEAGAHRHPKIGKRG